MYLSEGKRKLLSGAVLLAGVLVLQPIWAQSGNMGKPQSEEFKRPQASLQAQARAEVQHDTVKIVLATEVNDTTQADVAKALNSVLEQAMKDAKSDAKVKVRSGDYRIWPMNDRDGKISEWRGRGEILLESHDFTAASEIATLLSDRMPVANLMFSVSPEKRAQQEQELLAEAAKAFRARAQSLAEAMGYSGYSLRQITLGGAGVEYRPVARMMMSPSMDAAAKSSVPLEGGTDEVSVSIQGSIFLQPAEK